jgi:hypothetical protein
VIVVVEQQCPVTRIHALEVAGIGETIAKHDEAGGTIARGDEIG